MRSERSKRDPDGEMFPSKRSLFAGRHEAMRQRHAEPGWFEWVFRELVRYWYALAVLAVTVFSDLQIVYWLVPANGPSGTDMLMTALAVIAASASIFASGAIVYRYAWGKDGWVDRLVERHEDELARRAADEQSAAPPGR